MTTLTSSFTGRKPFDQIQVNDLVTVSLAGGKECGGRITRISCGTYFVKLVGLSAPQPYEIGMIFPLSAEKITDWD